MNTLNTAAESPTLTEPVPVHPMSDYEKFLFDLKGFHVIPSVLTNEEIAIARDHIETYMKTPRKPSRTPSLTHFWSH